MSLPTSNNLLVFGTRAEVFDLVTSSAFMGVRYREVSKLLYYQSVKISQSGGGVHFYCTR